MNMISKEAAINGMFISFPTMQRGNFSRIGMRLIAIIGRLIGSLLVKKCEKINKPIRLFAGINLVKIRCVLNPHKEF